MKKYRISYEASCFIDIEAKSKEEAEEKFYKIDCGKPTVEEIVSELSINEIK